MARTNPDSTNKDHAEEVFMKNSVHSMVGRKVQLADRLAEMQVEYNDQTSRLKHLVCATKHSAEDNKEVNS